MEKTHAGAVFEKLKPMARTHIGQVCEELACVGPHAGTGEEREEEEEADTKHYKLTAALIPYPPAPLRAEQLEESGVKFSLGRKEESRGG